ncbi:MAG: NAD(P)-binding protein [Methylococcales bacterium]
MQNNRLLVIGVRFAGAVIAPQFATRGCYNVTVIDRRDHISGNAFDPVCSEAGNRFHQYGLYIFHADSQDNVGYLSQFTQWMDFRHRVMAYVEGVGQVSR